MHGSPAGAGWHRSPAFPNYKPCQNCYLPHIMPSARLNKAMYPK